MGERRHGNGAAGPNAYPRDHSKHRLCKGHLSKLCITYNQFDTLAARYRGESADETEKAIEQFHDYVLGQIPEDKLAGDMVWLLNHFNAWLVQIGRVAPSPTKSKNKKTKLSDDDLARIEQEIKDDTAAKKSRAGKR